MAKNLSQKKKNIPKHTKEVAPTDKKDQTPIQDKIKEREKYILNPQTTKTSTAKSTV